MSDFKIVKLLDAPVQINLPTGPDFTGEYDNTTSYSIGQSVSYNGSSYIALNATTGNPPPNTLFWQLLAEKGDTGAQGPQGESYPEAFETVSKNLKSWNASFNYTLGSLTSIVYTSGKPYVEYFYRSLPKDSFWREYVSTKELRFVVIHIPKGSIKSNYELDAK